MEKPGTYKGYIQQKRFFILLLGLVTVLTALLAVSAGSANLGLSEVVMALAGRGSGQARMIIFNIRLPRIITAIIAGIGLAALGCAMQSLFKNPLASSSTLGISLFRLLFL